MGRINADLSAYEAFEDFTPVPPGEYVVVVENTDVKISKSGNEMVSVEFAIQGPSHVGRKLFDQYVLTNEIALKRLKSLASAAGHRNPNYISDSEELHGLKCIVKVKIDEQEGTGYSPKNVISAFKPIDGVTNQYIHPQNPVPQMSPAKTSQAQQTKKTNPWSKQAQA